MSIPRIEGYYPHSSEKEITKNYLRNRLKKSYSSFLDVGCGRGLLTELFYPFSERVQLVEISPYYQEALKTKFPNAEINICDIWDAPLGNGYDLILVSQSLYYHSTDQWKLLIEKLMKHLLPDGELIIILNKDEGDWWESIRPVWQTYPEALKFSYRPSTTFITELSKNYNVLSETIEYGLNFKDKEAVREFILKACSPIHEKHEKAKALLERHLENEQILKCQQKYLSEIAVLTHSY